MLVFFYENGGLAEHFATNFQQCKANSLRTSFTNALPHTMITIKISL